MYAAYGYIGPKVTKQLSEGREREIWEGKARRIDAEEAAVLRRAQIEEAKREQQELRQRLVRLDAALAVVDEEFHGETRTFLRSQVGGFRGVDHRTGNEG